MINSSLRTMTRNSQIKWIIRYLCIVLQIGGASSWYWRQQNTGFYGNQTIPPIPPSSCDFEAIVRQNPSSLIDGSTMYDYDYQAQSLPFLKTVMVVSVLNICINVMRPDPFVGRVMRLPRILWEACIGNTAVLAQVQPLFILMLSLMTFLTSVLDIFVWGPMFAFFTSWERCTVGACFSGQPQICVPDYIMGSSRLLASIQSTLGGFFYLVVAVVSWRHYWEQQERRRINRQTNAMHHVLNHHHLLLQQRGPIANGFVRTSDNTSKV